jgi:hypothetical protein
MMMTKFKLTAALATLAVTLFAAPMIASADTATAGFGATHSAHHHHHHHHRHRH